VVEFDGDRGLGVVEATSGVRYLFHCTQIADGTRAIVVGAAVGFRIRAGARGVWEATELHGVAGVGA
jgi:CspA family cold shock protein